MPTKEQPLTIREDDINSRVRAFEAGIKSIDPEGTRFPLVRQCLRTRPEKLNLHDLHNEAVELRRKVPSMRFSLTSGPTRFSPICVELGSPLRSLRPGSLGGIALGPLERDFIDRTADRVVPIERRVEAYLDFLIRITSGHI